MHSKLDDFEPRAPGQWLFLPTSRRACLKVELQELSNSNIYSFDQLITKMAVLADLHFSKTKQSRKQYKTSKKPWIFKAILTFIKTQNNLFRKLLKHESDKSYEIYKVYGNMPTRTKKAAKVMYYQKLIENSKASSDTWKIVNNSIRRTKQNSNLPNFLQVNNRNLNDPFTICHELQEHFCNIQHKLAANTQTTRQHNSTMFFGQTISNLLC